MCDSKDLVANEKYILFLEKKQKGNDFYMQSGAAVPYSNTKIDELVQMCNLEMNYPEGTYMMVIPSRKHAYILLTPFNPTFIQ